MIENSTMSRALSLKVLILLLIAFAIGILFVNDKVAYIQGLLLGGIFTILKIKLMESTFKRAMNKEPNAAKRYVQAHYMMRYFLSFIVLFVGIVTPTINSIAVILALLSLKAAAYWQGFLEPKTPLDGSVEFLEWEDDEEPSDF
jgi:hypothetical protein